MSYANTCMIRICLVLPGFLSLLSIGWFWFALLMSLWKTSENPHTSENKMSTEKWRFYSIMYRLRRDLHYQTLYLQKVFLLSPSTNLSHISNSPFCRFWTAEVNCPFLAYLLNPPVTGTQMGIITRMPRTFTKLPISTTDSLSTTLTWRSSQSRKRKILFIYSYGGLTFTRLPTLYSFFFI